MKDCGGTSTFIIGTVPTNIIHVPIRTGTVTDSGSVNTDLLVMLGRYIYTDMADFERWVDDRLHIRNFSAY